MAAPDSSLSPASAASGSDGTRTHCPYCAFQCGMELRFEEGKPSGTSLPIVKADPGFPVNRGQMCIKGFNSSALFNHEDRITDPMLRDANGKWRKASWEESLAFIAERVGKIQRDSGKDAVGAFGSGALTNEKAYYLGKFVRVALGSANIDYNGRYCMSSAAAGQNRAFGIDRGMPFPVSDIAETKTLLLWGSNCSETMPPIMQWVQEQKQRGEHLIVVDPRMSETARAATLHLQLVPGTDLTLALGLIHLAIEENLIDAEYIATRTEGFEDLRRSVLAIEPRYVERVTGVSIEKQRQTVHQLAKASSSMLLSGRGVEQQSKGADTVNTLINLMLVLGRVGKPASGYGCLTGQGNGQGGREHGQKADQLPGYRLIEDPKHRAEVAKHWGIAPEALPRKGKSAYELLDSLGPKGIRALFVFGSNVVVASPNIGNIERKLAALDLLVVVDAYLNETAEYANVFLPTTQFGEEFGTMTNLEGRVILRRKLLDPPSNVKSDLEILSEIARVLGKPHGFENPRSEAVFDEFRRVTSGAKADYSGITYERIERENGVHWPCPSEEHPGTPRLFERDFPRPGGRAQMLVVHHRPVSEVPDATYPIYFTTGRYKEHYNSGAQTRRVKKLMEVRGEPILEMHPRLGSELGVEDGGLVFAESRRGSVLFRVKLTYDVRYDTVFAPFHWGGRDAANRLTIDTLDPTSRMPEFKVCAVRLRSASEQHG